MPGKRVSVYELGRTLGEGTFGKVKLATNTETGQRFAIKIIEKKSIRDGKLSLQLEKEITVMRKVDHPNIVKLYEVMRSQSRIYLVMELVTGGELFDLIVAKRRLREEEARNFFQQLVLAVKYMHSIGVCHRDLKPENLLLSGDMKTLKISDFGLSAYQRDAPMQKTACGTPNYVAPEVLSGKQYDGRTADVWSCGVILFVMLAGYLPFEEDTNDKLWVKIRSADFQFPANNFGPAVRRLIKLILTPDSAHRITLDGIIADPWFQVNLPENFRPRVGDQPRITSDDLMRAVRDVPDESRALANVSNALAPPQMSSPMQIDGMMSPPSPMSPATAHAASLGIPKTMNAFELIASTMLDISPMFLDSNLGYRRNTSFSSRIDPKQLMVRLETALAAERIIFRTDRAKFKIRLVSASGRTLAMVQVIGIAPPLHAVEFQRRRVPALEFHSIFDKIKTHCSDVTCTQ